MWNSWWLSLIPKIWYESLILITDTSLVTLSKTDCACKASFYIQWCVSDQSEWITNVSSCLLPFWQGSSNIMEFLFINNIVKDIFWTSDNRENQNIARKTSSRGYSCIGLWSLFFSKDQDRNRLKIIQHLKTIYNKHFHILNISKTQATYLIPSKADDSIRK